MLEFEHIIVMNKFVKIRKIYFTVGVTLRVKKYSL